MEQFIMKGGNPLVGEDRESARRKRYQCTAGSDPGDWSFWIASSSTLISLTSGSDPGDWSFCGPDRPAHSKN